MCSQNLPSLKRQRVTVSAMRRLFAKFSLSDRDPKDTSSRKALTDSDTINNSGERNQRNIPRNSSASDLPALLPSSSQDDSSVINDSSNSNNNKDIPNMNECSNHTTVKRDTTSSDNASESSKGKRQKTTHSAHKLKNQETKNSPDENRLENTNKRQADVNDSDNEEEQQNENKVKRTRRLRRGLRLCTNITCYIEQVIYN